MKKRRLNTRGKMVLSMLGILVLIILLSISEKKKSDYLEHCIDTLGNSYNYCYGQWTKDNA